MINCKNREKKYVLLKVIAKVISILYNLEIVVRLLKIL